MLEPLYVIPHLPKTAGNTLIEHFNNHLQEGGDYFLLGPQSSLGPDTYELSHQRLRAVPQVALGRVRVVFGHYLTKPLVCEVFPDREIRFATFLRDPAERWVSEYNFKLYMKKIDQDTTLEQYYYSFRDRNYLCHWFSYHFLQNPFADHRETFHSVRRELEGFDLVGTVENFAVDSRALCDLIGLPPIRERHNVAGRDFPRKRRLTAEFRESIRRDCQADYALYGHFLDTRMPAAKTPLEGRCSGVGAQI